MWPNSLRHWLNRRHLAAKECHDRLCIKWFHASPHSLDILHFTYACLWRNFRVVLPISLLFIFLISVVFRRPVESIGSVIGGLCSAFIGLAMFTQGLRLSLMPLGKRVGSRLLQRFSTLMALLIVLLLGILITYAEPAINALLSLSVLIKPEKLPYLFYLLNSWSELLVFTIGFGMGVSAMIGTLRLLYNIKLGHIICATITIAISITIYMTVGDSRLHPFIGLCWDIGSIVTGPVAIPTLLALGIGISSSSSHAAIIDEPLSGFGMVAIASLCPIITVQILSIILVSTVSLDVINGANVGKSQNTALQTLPLWGSSPFAEILYGLRAILPTTAALFILSIFTGQGVPELTVNDIVGFAGCSNEEENVELADTDLPTRAINSEIPLERESICVELIGTDPQKKFNHITVQNFTASLEQPDVENQDQKMSKYFSKRHMIFWAAVGIMQIGIILFNLGLTYSFNVVGTQGGALLPAAFQKLPSDDDPVAFSLSPYFPYALGMFIVFVFVLILSFLVIRAEPALYIFCAEVEFLTKRTITASHLKQIISLGCAFGMVIGILSMINYEMSLGWLFIGLNIGRLILTAVSNPTAVSVSWDSAGIATGPISVPFVLSLGLGFIKTIQPSTGSSSTGFGLVALIAANIVLVMLVAMDLTKWWRHRAARIRQQSADDGSVVR